MGLLDRLFRTHRLSDEERQKKGERLDARRRHLRGKISKVQGELHREWTRYRNWRADDAGKKKLRAHLKHLEAERKLLTKEMLKLQAEMKDLGFKAAAGYVEAH